MNRITRSLLLGIWAGAAALGCASPPGGGAIQDTGTAAHAGAAQITVRVDASPLQAERREAFLEHGGSAKVVGAVLEELAATSESPRSGPYTIDVTVTGFRLRSTQSGLWFGFMAGADSLHVSVSVRRDGAPEKEFQTNAHTAVAGLIRPSSVSRFDRMVKKLAERIVAGL